MKKLILCFCGILILTSLTAQRLVRITSSTPICAVEGNADPKDRYADKASPEAQRIIEDICRQIGVSPDVFIIEAANVNNAEALILHDKRYIHYNPLYINRIKKESQTYWAMIFVLAHEIGHHANFHTIEKVDLEKRRLEELAADKFAGCALRHLGANADELERAVSILNEKGDDFHPQRSDRLMFAMRGWEDCQPKRPPQKPDPVIKNPAEKEINTAKECYKNNTGDLYFKNATRAQIKIHTSPQRGWYDQYNFITISPGETKAFLNLKAGVHLFTIRQLAQGGFVDSFRDYSNEEIRINACDDQSNPATVIR